MKKTLTDQTLALAGMFQAAAQVQQVARKGRVDSEPFDALLKSIVTTEVANAEEAYGGVASLKEGLRALIANLGSDPGRRDVEQTRYVITLLHLERKLVKNRRLLDAIVRGIDNARRQAEHFPLTHENVIASFADVYANSVSTLTPRIMVTGEHGYLNQPESANKVRALLLAGMRAAILWRWAGGGRFRLLFNRRRYLEEAERLLRAQ
jgi:high frequency lysogenization protein